MGALRQGKSSRPWTLQSSTGQAQSRLSLPSATPVPCSLPTVTAPHPRNCLEKEFCALHSHWDLQLLAGKWQERETGSGVGSSLDLRCIERAKKPPKTHIVIFLNPSKDLYYSEGKNMLLCSSMYVLLLIPVRLFCILKIRAFIKLLFLFL